MAKRTFHPLAAIMAVCGTIFREPERIRRAHWFTLNGPPAPAHRHDDLLQADLALHCGGAWVVDGVTRPAGPATLSLFYPGQAHAYDLRPARPTARVLSLKLQVEPTWPAIARRVWTPHCDLHGAEPLVRAWERLVRAVSAGESAAHHQALRVAELLCLFPRQGARPGGDALVDQAALDEPVDRAMRHVERNLHQPLSLGALAAEAGLSPRHLTRRFRAVCGCSPHVYLDRRRLARADELLLQEQVYVTGIARELGFETVHSFSRWYRRKKGLPPTRFRQQPRPKGAIGLPP